MDKGSHGPVDTPSLAAHAAPFNNDSILRENLTSIRAMVRTFTEHAHDYAVLYHSLCRWKGRKP